MPRNQTNSNEFFAGILPTISFQDKKYFVDGRIKEMRNTEDFFDKLEDTDEVWELLSKEDKAIICYEYHGARIGEDDSEL